MNRSFTCPLPHAWRSGLVVACLVALVGCATTDPHHPWPQTVVGIDKMAPIGPWDTSLKVPKEEKRPQGTVVVRIHVDAMGAAQYAEVYQSSGNRHVDAAGLLAGKQGKFKPYLDNGKPVAVTVMAPITF